MKLLHLSQECSMQKCAEQNTNIRSKVLLYQLLEFHALGDHQTESCLREVISYKRFKFKNGWKDASSDWLPRRTCFRGGVSLLAQSNARLNCQLLIFHSVTRLLNLEFCRSKPGARLNILQTTPRWAQHQQHWHFVS